VKQFKEGLAQTGFQGLGLSERKRLLEAFDAEFYLNQNPGLRDHHLDAFTHYMTLGWRQCRDPSANFNTLEYLLSHRDVLRSGANPFVVAILGGKVSENDESLGQRTIIAG
jgi:hypothetical protein